MEKSVALKDGREILVREMTPADIDASFAFFNELEAEDRKYLRRDVTRWEVVRDRVGEMESGRVVRLVAIDGDKIVADGSLQLTGHGWGDNVAEIRLIVAPDVKRVGIGTRLAKELYILAAKHRMDRIVARMMRPQRAARAIFRKLGFHDEFLIPEHVRDQSGVWQDLIIMRCNLADLWHEMESQVLDADLRLHR